MRNFLEVYNTNKERVDESNRISADKQRVELLKALKREYGIQDFKSLSESEKTTYKRMNNEMWDANNSLNEKGLKFGNESEITLTKESEKEEIIKAIKNMFNENLYGYFEGMTGKRFTGGSNPKMPKVVREVVEKTTGRKFKPENFKAIYKELLCKLVDESDMF